MDFITTGVITSAVYDVLKNGLTLSAGALKERLGQWLREDVIAESVANEVANLGIDETMSELVITRRLEQSSEMADLIRTINSTHSVVAPSTIGNVTQTHSGSGDNVAGSKITK